MDVRRILKNLDWFLILAVVVLMGTGLVLIDSATHSYAMTTGKAWHVQRQSVFMLIGFAIIIVSLKFDYQDLKSYAKPLYIFNLVLLIAVMAFGKTQLGAQRWIQIGSFSFQPSEFSKVFLIICLADFIERRIEWLENFKDYIPIFFYIFVPFVMVMKQPDLGTALTFIAIFIGMIFVCGFKWKWIAGCVVSFVALLPVFWMVLQDYQKNRIRVFLNPELDPFGSGYHVIQSKIAIGSGGLTGMEWGQGVGKFWYLPEAHTDFAFAIFCQENGFLGAVVLILAYSILAMAFIRVCRDVKDSKAFLLSYGITFLVIGQAAANMCMVTGIFPVIGVPLPFISYGGSSMAVTMAAIGLFISIYNEESYANKIDSMTPEERRENIHVYRGGWHS